MGKLEKLEQLQKLKESGSLTEEEFKQEKEKLLGGENKKSKKVIIIILTVVLLVCIVGGIYYFISNKSVETSSSGNSKKDETGFEQASANMQANGTQNLSFGNMNSDDENYTKIQQEIIDYFDNDYINFSVRYAQRYPNVFKDAKVTTIVTVEKVLKSTDEEYEVLAKENTITGNDTMSDINATKDEQLLLISGKQLEKRLAADDYIYVYGRYKGVESREIDGKSYMVSKIQANTIEEVKYSKVDGILKSRYNYKTIKDVAEYIFGKDIKISETDEFEDDGYYKVILDNQSNANFKAFIMSESDGGIDYATQENNLTSNITKKLFVSADFEHYIVSTYDENTKHVYIDYFDKDLKKVWNKEFDYNSTKAFVSPMDYTADKMAIVVDNDLYLIDLKTGDFLIEPVLVGEKIKVNMMSDGIILIGDNNKDTIMKVDYTGKILYKINADTKMNQIVDTATQIVNGKMVVKLEGSYPIDYNNNMSVPTKYIVINNDGTVETSTEDFDAGFLLL